MDRGNHYEAAFEAYLRDARLAYVAVNEARRTTLDDEPVKSVDFIVYGQGPARLLVDVKGRKFPGGKPNRLSFTWQSWSTLEDVAGLERWEQRFGLWGTALFVGVLTQALSFLCYAHFWNNLDASISRLGQSYAPLCENPWRTELIAEPQIRHRMLAPVLAWLVGLRGMQGVAVPIFAITALGVILYRLLRDRGLRQSQQSHHCRTHSEGRFHHTHLRGNSPDGHGPHHPCHAPTL